MTLAIIATIALLYAFCIAVGVLFTGIGDAVEGARVGATIATGVVVLVACIAGVGHLWNVAA